jgi:hypothetical protein
MGAREDPSEQRCVRGAPAGRFGRRRHVEHLEELAAFVQGGNRAMRAGIIPMTRPDIISPFMKGTRTVKGAVREGAGVRQSALRPHPHPHPQ